MGRDIGRAGGSGGASASGVTRCRQRGFAAGDHPIAGKRPLRHGMCVSWGRETRMTVEYLVSVSAAAVLSGSLLLALGMARMARLTQLHESWER